MTERPPGGRLDLREITVEWRSRGVNLSEAMAFGLGAGLYFEYFSQSGRSPSHYFTGHNRRFADELAARAIQWNGADKGQVIRDALRANALAMDLDRSNYTAIMGMELLAEDFENWASAVDGRICAAQGAREIGENLSLHRGHYLRFLHEASAFDPATLSLMPVLAEVVSQWDMLGRVLQEIADSDQEGSFVRAAQVVRRAAVLEENFWGEIINRTE